MPLKADTVANTSKQENKKKQKKNLSYPSAYSWWCTADVYKWHEQLSF